MKMKTWLGIVAALAFTAAPLMSANAAPPERKQNAQPQRGGHAGAGNARRGNQGNATRGQVQRQQNRAAPKATWQNPRQQNTTRQNTRRQNDATRRQNTNNRQHNRQNNATRNRTGVQNNNAQRNRNARRADRRPHFSDNQRVRIRNYWRRHHNYRRVARVAFPIFVGAFIPRSYAIYDLPTDFYGYVPGYEGYKYIVVGDELLIIDPDTYEVVAVIPV